MIGKMQNLTGLVSVTRNVHGVEVRGLNYADLALMWNKNAKGMIEAYDKVMKATETETEGKDESDVVKVATAIIQHAPDIACQAFLAAINDKGETHNINGENLTAAEVWTNHMAFGKQTEVLLAILDLTLSESDVIKKKWEEIKTAMMNTVKPIQVVQPLTAEQKVMTALQPTQ